MNEVEIKPGQVWEMPSGERRTVDAIYNEHELRFKGDGDLETTQFVLNACKLIKDTPEPPEIEAGQVWKLPGEDFKRTVDAADFHYVRWKEDNRLNTSSFVLEHGELISEPEPTGNPLLVAAAAVVHARKRLKQLNSETDEQEKRMHKAKESLKAGMKDRTRNTNDVFVIGDYSIQWGVMGWEVREVTRL